MLLVVFLACKYQVDKTKTNKYKSNEEIQKLNVARPEKRLFFVSTETQLSTQALALRLGSLRRGTAWLCCSFDDVT